MAVGMAVALALAVAVTLAVAGAGAGAGADSSSSSSEELKPTATRLAWLGGGSGGNWYPMLTAPPNQWASPLALPLSQDGYGHT